MTLLFAMNEVEGLDSDGSYIANDTSSAGGIDTIYSDGGSLYGTQGLYHFVKIFSAQSDFWLHLDYEFNTSNSYFDFDIITLFDSVGDDICRVGATNANIYLEYHNGSTWVAAAGAGAFAPANVPGVYDLHCVIHGTTGEFTLYFNGEEAFSFTGDTTQNGIDVAKLFLSQGTGATVGRTNYFSQIMGTGGGDSTIGNKLAALKVTGDGYHTDFTGAYADINNYGRDNASYIDSTYLASASGGDRETVAVDGLKAGVPGDMTVDAVIVSARMNAEVGGPSDLKTSIRIASTDYDSAALSVADTGFTGYQSIFETNPATAIAWTQADLSSIEVGVLSVA